MQRLVISASISVAQHWIVPRLARQATKPNLQISITTVNLEQDFITANAEVEIRYGRGHWTGGQCARLFEEVLTPKASPSLLATCGHWQELPLISNVGPCPGWQDWAAKMEYKPLPPPQYRFDTFASALAAAEAGLGVILGSLPLTQPALICKNLERVSDAALTPPDSYCMLNNANLPAWQWRALSNQLCDSTPK